MRSDKEKKFVVLSMDEEGPSLENRFIPSITVQGEKDHLCVGLRYNGGSSLDDQSYEYDHANRHRGNRSWSMNRLKLDRELNNINTSVDELKEEFVKRLVKPLS